MTRRRLALFAVAARDDGRLRSVVAWSCLAVVASPLVTGCGARSELPIPNAPYVVLFPISAGVENDAVLARVTQTFSLWHSRTKTISTVGTYASELATMSFDGRFIAVNHCAAGSCAGEPGVALDVLAPDGAIVWSQPEAEWLGALRPDGQRVLVGVPLANTSSTTEFSLCVLDRGSTPVPIRTESQNDYLIEPSYARDGETIVAVQVNSSQVPAALVTMRDDGTRYTTLDVDGGAFYAPSFDFDGTAIVYTVLRPMGFQDVAVVDVASHESRIVHSGTQFSWNMGRFTPDGLAIVIQELDETNVETLRHIDLATGEASILWQGHASSYSYPEFAVAADD